MVVARRPAAPFLLAALLVATAPAAGKQGARKATPAARVAAPAPRPAAARSHTVYPGQTLGKIARRYRVTVDAIRHANGLHHGAKIRPGQRLVIPPEGVDPGEARIVPTPGRPERWQDYAEPPRRKGYVVLESPTKHWRGQVLSARGGLLPRAKEGIERMFASWRTGARHAIDPRLVHALVRISDTFGGRTVRVVSGYRERSFVAESKHKVGKALDFSIPGIPNPLVRDFLRTLPRVGVGYYPNSTHVHVDVREYAAYWVDHARPGEAPRLHAGAGPRTDEEGAEDEDEAGEAPGAAAEPAAPGDLARTSPEGEPAPAAAPRGRVD